MKQRLENVEPHLLPNSLIFWCCTIIQTFMQTVKLLDSWFISNKTKGNRENRLIFFVVFNHNHVHLCIKQAEDTVYTASYGTTVTID